VPCSPACFARKRIAVGENHSSSLLSTSDPKPSGKAEGVKGQVSILPSRCKRNNGLPPFSRSEIPLRTLLPCALCEKKNRAKRTKSYFHHHNLRSSAFPRLHDNG
jgi:hypothetical protein